MELNREYAEDVRIIQIGDNLRDIEKAIRNLMQLRNVILSKHPEYIVSITDIDFYIANGAYRINDVTLFEQTVQKHYYDDYRFKKLYQSYKEIATANVWNNIVKMNATKLEKTFVRSISVIILTGVCLSLIFRK
ncbi:hypothetical protein [Drosophila suzukii associated hytrosavirus 1]|nr:hypothetical protein [Drosophila suzukii associated hytrosavirus 1]